MLKLAQAPCEPHYSGSLKKRMFRMGRAQRVFCTIDPVTLKTIVRAKPGLFVVQNGIVIDKKNFRQL